MTAIPPIAPFPPASIHAQLSPQDWTSLTTAWTTLTQASLTLPLSQIAKNEDLVSFITTFTTTLASTGPSILGPPDSSKPLLRAAFTLASLLYTYPNPPVPLTSAPFLCAFAKLYRKNAPPVFSGFFKSHPSVLDTSLSALKKSLTQSLEAGLKADLSALELRLANLNHLLHASPTAASFFLAGSDFLDGLITAFKITNPPLRKVLIATTYVCLVGLTEGEDPRFGMLADVLFSLKSAAEAHKSGPLNVNDSLVAELVTSTPVLKQILKKAEDKGAATTALKTRISALEGFRKPGGGLQRPKRLVKRKVDKKGKGVAGADDFRAEVHMHRQSQIALIQDLFPDLGSGFISKLFDEFGDDTEIVTAHLLEDSLPPHLASADRSAQLSPKIERRFSQDIAPRPTPPQVPQRHNVFDDDELDRLELDVSKLHFGKKPAKTADDVLKDRSTAPNKAAILSALAAFDSDDDERDDTYDADDVGGTVDNTAEEADGQHDASEETLFKAFQADPNVFDRQATTRRTPARAKLREETGMTDEAIEGWAVMLARNPAQKRRLEAKYSGAAAFTGIQAELASTSWRAGSGAEDEGEGSSSRGRGGARGRGRGGRGRGRGNVAGATGDKDTEAARRRKEASKSSRANHNRRDQRAKKMARGGFAG
ncbi:CUE domain-containing protein 3 [Colletotrichum trifolii]|uniref:CUE domain-containing protein 3 n=1 Tax=Colletotrichum trifolii TaxID=5466 RepID=A0A4V3HW96_COLTR|nr:CUE domain-containing protein 3 [Colletotrichum trifolii]